jgi:hypothetical protein
MKHRAFGLVDLGVVVVIAVAVALPPREMYATTAIKGDDAQQFALGLAEARTMARPGDGLAVEQLMRRLRDAGMKDWAIEASVLASERAKGSPTRWRALLAASVAYVDKLDVVPALDYANRALAACEAALESGDAASCPSWEQIRMRLYQQHLDAGVKSGKDPRRDPIGFQKAGEATLRSVYLGTQKIEHDDRKATGSGSGSSAAPTPAPAPAPSPAPTP